MHQEVTRFKNRYKLPQRSQKVAKVLVIEAMCLIKIIVRSCNFLKNVYNLSLNIL